MGELAYLGDWQVHLRKGRRAAACSIRPPYGSRFTRKRTERPTDLAQRQLRDRQNVRVFRHQAHIGRRKVRREKILCPARNELQRVKGLRSKGKNLVVPQSSSAGIKSQNRLFKTIIEAVKRALRDKRLFVHRHGKPPGKNPRNAQRPQLGF